jgi:hypothetical protein
MRFAKVLSFGLPALFIVVGPSSALAGPKTCDLISAQTAAAIFGGPTGPGTEQVIAAAGRQCVFETNGGGEVALGLMDKANMAALGAKPADIPRMLNEPQPGQHTETIPSLGEWNTLIASPADSSLYVLQHGYLLTLSASGSKNPGLKAALVQAAKQAIAKL